MTVAMLTIGGKGKVTGDYSYIYFFYEIRLRLLIFPWKEMPKYNEY